MKYKIEENLIIEAESENEEFCFINAFADGTEGIIDICPNYKRDLELYKSYSTTDHFYPDRGSRMFYFSVGSLSEYLEVLSYLSESGWTNYLLIDPNKTWGSLIDGRSYKKLFTKNPLTIKKIKEAYNLNKNYYGIDSIFGYAGSIFGYEIKIRIDFNKLNKFRNDMMGLAGYKCLWKNNGKGDIIK